MRWVRVESGLIKVFKPRPYQREAVNALFKFFSKKKGNPLIVMPTGTGKSIVIGITIDKCLVWAGTRIIMITHVKELIEQDIKATKLVNPKVDCGIYSAGLKKRENKDVMFASIQSVYKKAFYFDPFDIIIIDEAHLISKKNKGMYRKFIDDSLMGNPQVRVVGFTATDFRTKEGVLTEGDERLFTDVCFELKMRDMIEQGYLSKLVSAPSKIQPDLKNVTVRMGDYAKRELSVAMTCGVTEQALDEACVLAKDRRSWLIFCVSVTHAKQVSESLNKRGISCEYISGETPPKKRADILKRYKDGDLRAVSNCMVLTTGFDNPKIDCIIFLRPTKSAGLFIQMAGRGTRLHKGKKDCLCLDYARLVQEHGPVDQIEVKTIYTAMEGEKRELKSTPMKECPHCKELVEAGLRECQECGFEFPNETLINHASKASSMSILAKPEIIEVGKVEYHLHQKNGKKSLKVSYYRPKEWLNPFVQEWVLIEYSGLARVKAVKWWNQKTDMLTPETVEEALKKVGSIKTPRALKVIRSGKFWKIISYLY